MTRARLDRYLFTCNRCGIRVVLEQTKHDDTLPPGWVAESPCHTLDHSCNVCYPLTAAARAGDKVAQAALRDRRLEMGGPS